VELREKIDQYRGSVDRSLVALKNGLKQRSEAATARETLELLLDTFHVVSKVRLCARASDLGLFGPYLSLVGIRKYWYKI